MKPMKLTDVGAEQYIVDEYINDDAWIMQQKFDGARMMVHYRFEEGRHEVFFTNDGVKPIAFSAAKLKLPALETALIDWLSLNSVLDLVLDGELIIDTGVYYVFDVLRCRVGDSETWVEATATLEELHKRLSLLKSLVASSPSSLIEFSYTATTADEKARLWKSIVTAGVEGAVSKHVESTYEPGTRTKEWVKHKLVKTADVVVTHAERTFKPNGVVSHGKAELAVPIAPESDPLPWVHKRGKRISRAEYAALPPKKTWDYDEVLRDMLPVGNASLIGKDLAIEPGSVVEVEYLYWTGDAMIQPRIKRLRTDKTFDECDLSQFPEYTRKAVQP